MKTKYVVLLIVVAVAAGAAGWFAARRGLVPSLPTTPASVGAARKPLYYQSAMHPWIKSDKPGRCTICGMELTPVYQGDKGFEAGEGLVTLGSNIIQVIDVQTEEIRRQPLRRQFRFAGSIDDNDARHRVVSAYVDGRIDELAVNYVGAEVIAGQPLATFYSPMLLAAEREYTAIQRAHASQSGNADEQRRLLAAAAQRLRRLGLTEAQVAALPAKTETNDHSGILAPVSGTVTLRNVYAGQYVKEGDKLFEIADFATMWFLFDAYERDLVWLKPGQQVEISTPALPGQTFTGAVAFIDPNLKEMTRSAKVRVELSNPLVEENGRPHRVLRHKLYAEGVVQVEVPEVLAVPRTAVLSPGPQPVVYVDKGGSTYEQRRLRLGRAGDDLWEVLDGLAEGERVVTTGSLLIDAQAQLNQSVATAGGPPPAPGSTPADTPFTQDQIQSINAFLTTATAVAEALASDNLAGFNQQAAAVHTSMPSFLTAFDAHPSWQPLVEKIEGAGHLETVTALAAARRSFLPFSAAVTAFGARLRQHPAFTTLKIYQCPMVNQAVPGAPKTGQWLQRQGPLRNPYFGAEMLDCGTEVK